MKNKVLIVTADYYQDISNNLEIASESVLKKYKLKYKKVRVPGVFEIPVIISKNINKFDGFIALGCVIKGQTPHFDFISKATTYAIMNLSIKYKKPVTNGIITALNKTQAKARSQNLLRKNKGLEATKAMISVLKIFNKKQR